jgi:hypothetical protein
MVGRVPAGRVVPVGCEPGTVLPEVEPVPRRAPKPPAALAGTPWLVKHWMYLVIEAGLAGVVVVVAPAAVWLERAVVGLAPDVVVPPPQAATAAESASAGPISRNERRTEHSDLNFTLRVQLLHMKSVSESPKSWIRTRALPAFYGVILSELSGFSIKYSLLDPFLPAPNLTGVTRAHLGPRR